MANTRRPRNPAIVIDELDQRYRARVANQKEIIDRLGRENIVMREFLDAINRGDISTIKAARQIAKTITDKIDEARAAARAEEEQG